MKRIILKNMLLIIVAYIVLSANASIALCFQTNQSYYYTESGEPVEIEAPYHCDSIINVFQGEKLKNPSDIVVHDEYIFICDSGNNRILKLNNDYKILMTIKDFKVDGVDDSLNAPLSLFISDDDTIYIADSNNGRIVIFDKDGVYVRQVRPYGQEFDNETQPFIPTSLVIDKTGRLLVNSSQVYKGIITMNQNGEFLGYFAANKAKINPLQYFWKSIATREQRDNMALDIPTEIYKIHLDKDGFPYVISNAFSKTMSPKEVENEMPVRKLNLTGDNILNFSDSDHYPIGDLKYTVDTANNKGASNFIDICTTEFGIYYILDNSQGRIFVYNQTGRNIMTFGGRGGLQAGTLKAPIALDYYKGKLLVLDRSSGSVNIFVPTQFGQMILDAFEMHYNGDYEEAGTQWVAIKDNYGYYDPAYLGIGKVLLYQQNYEEAMKYFEIARDKEYYSTAFKHVRKDKVEENFVIIFVVIIVFMISVKIFSKPIKKFLSAKFGSFAIIQTIRHAFYTTIHPFKGFADIKEDREGDYKISIALVFLLAIVMFMKRTGTAFLYRVDHANVESLVKHVGSTLLIVFLWIAVLYLMEIFLEGEAKLSHVIHSTAYSLIPVIISYIISIIMTFGASLDDAAMINTILVFGWTWSIFLIFIGIIVTNDYTFTRTIVAGVVNVAGMIIIFMISVLFISLIQDILIFISFTIRELKGVFML